MKRIAAIISLFVIGLAAMAACAPVNLLNNITPSSGYVLQKGISFGDHPRFELDVYEPKKSKADAPLIIFVHGGGWNDGSKDIYKFVGEAFTSEGYITVIPNYRLHPNSVFPDPVTDTANAIAWAAKTYPDRSLVIMGHSAGGYNVLMAGLDPQYLKSEGVDLCDHVAGIVSIAGPTGIIPLKEEPYITVFPDRFTKTDAPLNLAANPSPSILFLHGGKDDTVYPQNSQKLADKTVARGGEANVKIYPQLGHINIIKVLSRYFDEDASVKSDLVTFIEGLPTKPANFCQ